MVKVLGISASVGIVILVGIFQLRGIAVVPHVSLLPKIQEAVVAIAIVTEASLSGFHTKKRFWKRNWFQLVLLLTIALLCRGIAIFLVASRFGLQHSSLIATGLTATDPAAIGISLSLVGRADRLESLFWLLTVESLLNDAEGLIAFQTANQIPIGEIVITVTLTLVAAVFLALADAGVRWLVRMRFLQGSIYEAKGEVIAVVGVYVCAVLLGIRANLSLIGMCAVGAIFADYLVQQLPHERTQELDFQRENWQEKWSFWGLGAVFCMVVVLLPVRNFLLHWQHILPVSFAIVAAIFASRVVYDTVVANLRQVKRKRPHEYKRAGVSMMVSVCLLGVPGIVASTLWIQGLHLESTIVFTTIFLSWFTVFPAVFYIRWLRSILNHIHQRNTARE